MTQTLPETRRVLVTGAGAPGTLEMLRSLDRTGRYELIGVDANHFSAGFPLVQRHYLVPFAAAPEFPGAMQRVLDRERPHFVVPLIDEEIPIVHQLVATHFPSTRVVAPRLAFATLAMDKWAMACALTKAGLHGARTWLASDAGGCTYPAIIKPRAGRGSRGFKLLAGPGDLDEYLSTASEPADHYIVQERLFGREFTTSVVVTLDGRLLAVVPKEAVDKRGITRVGVTRVAPTIDKVCRSIQEELKADGPFNVQLMLDANETPSIFEVNPRYSTSTALTIAAGLDEVDLVLRAALGEPVGNLSYRPNLMMIRHETQFFVDEAEWHPEIAQDLK